MDHHDSLRPLASYEVAYDMTPRAYAAPTTPDRELWMQWRSGFTQRLQERLGAFPGARTTLSVRTGRVSQHAGYRREYLEFESEPGVTVPAWVLIPDGLRAPAPAVVALHGHGYGVDDIVGINADGTDRSEPQGYHKDFAVALCRRGFVVIAPELLAFGRRRERKELAQEPGLASCHDAALWGLMQGRTLLGRRVWDVVRMIDVLEARPEIDPRRIGVMGISGGGMVALFSAALDDRLRAAVISGYLCTFRDSILSIDHCLCNYVPGLLQDGEMYDIASLLAPRPLLVEAGTQDPIFPIAAVRASYAQVQHSYALLGAEERLDADFFEGDHQISGAKAYDWLWRWLHAD